MDFSAVCFRVAVRISNRKTTQSTAAYGREMQVSGCSVSFFILILGNEVWQNLYILLLLLQYALYFFMLAMRIVYRSDLSFES